MNDFAALLATSVALALVGATASALVILGILLRVAS